MISHIINKNVLKILWFYTFGPGRNFTRKEFQEKTKLPNTTLNETLNKLINHKILIKDKRQYRLNFENENAQIIIKLLIKEHAKLKNLPLKISFIIFEIIDFFEKYENIELFVFGSYSKIVYTENSDLDIAVITNKHIKYDKLIMKLENKFGIKIEIHEFDKNFYNNKKDLLIKDIIKNGIKLISKN